MGSCFSSVSSSPVQTRTAKVVALDGSLREYNSEVMAFEVLPDDRSSPCFICSSDELYCNAKIRALHSQDSLELGQLYFVLPASKLEYTLSGADMAALAIKAISALSALASRKQERTTRMTIRVSPVAAASAGDVLYTAAASISSVSEADASASKSTRSMRRGASKFRPPMRRRGCSDRESLSTIEEAVECE